MSIAATISDIVSKRSKDIAPKYDTDWEKAKEYIEFASKLNTLIKNEKWNILLNSYPEFKESWSKISSRVESFINSVFELIGVKVGNDYSPRGYFEAISSRINKEEIEVCITGPVSSGKSVFLRALTGAPDCVIPSGSSKTTAARTIFNNCETKKAVIKFLTKQEFEKIINEYVIHLNKILKERNVSVFDKWDSLHQTIIDYCEEIKNNDSYNAQNFPKSFIKGVDSIVTADLYFDTFQNYVGHVTEYADWIGQNDIELSEEEINRGELVKFVSYKKTLNDQNDNLYCAALSVREAIVDWPLVTCGNKDLGKIRLIDTMGIGEAKFCVEEDLLRIVKEHADLVIGLCRILSENSNKEDSATSSFIKVLSKIRDRKMEDWVYYLCNKETDAEITEPTVQAFKNQIWKEMQHNADYFTLNEEYWRSMSFINNGIPNQKDIVDYFVNTILGNLKNNISDVDKYFIDQLEKILDDISKEKVAIIKELGICLKVLPKFNDVYKIKEIDNTVELIYLSLRDELTKVRSQLFAKDNSLRETIIGVVKPVLKDPLIFQVYEVPDIEFDVDVAFTKVFQSVLFIINKILLEHDPFSVKWDDIEKSVVEQVAQNIGKEKAEVAKMLEEQKDFFSEYITKCCKAITTNVNNIKTNLNIDDPERSCNYTGRELEFFIKKREELYKVVWNKMSSASDFIGIKDRETIEVKETIFKAVKKVFEKFNILSVNEAEEQSSIQWIKEFISKIDSEALSVEIDNFLASIIDLPSIVDDQTGKELRKNLLNVKLDYHDELTAARSMWNCLFQLDCLLRKDLLLKYEQTFNTYDVYVNMATPLFDNVFCLNQHGFGKAHSVPYKDLKAYIKNIVTLNYEKEDSAKCSEAYRSYSLLCN